MTLDPNDTRNMAKRYAKAWSSHSPEAVASFYEEDGKISINNGDPTVGRAAIAEMAKGFGIPFSHVANVIWIKRHLVLPLRIGRCPPCGTSSEVVLFVRP